MAETNLKVAFTLKDGAAVRPLSYALKRGVNEWEQAEVLLNLTLENAVSDPAEYLDREASLEIDYVDDATAPVAFYGTVTQAGLEDNADGTSSMRLLVESPLWPLKRRLQSKIFRKLSAKAIIEQLLEGGGITCEKEFHGGCFNQVFEFFVQYEELDSEFLMRLLAGVGGSFLVVGEGGAPKVLFMDDVQGFASAKVELPYLPTFAEEMTKLAVTHVEFSRRVTPDKVVMTAYDPKRPRLAIEAEAEQEAGTSGNELYSPLSRFLEQGANDSGAKTLLAGHLLRRQEVRGVTGSLAVAPASILTIVGHPYAPLNAEFLVLEVTLAGALPREFNVGESGGEVSSIEFVAVPRDAVVRLEERPLSRNIAGVQTAKTTGAAGEEIDVSPDGEVTVSFYWDRSDVKDQHSSMPMRTAQLATGGAMLLPRVGWEVVVAFQEGQIDQPMVMSRLYNGSSPPPYGLPEGALKSSLQTATTPGDGSSNEMRFDDTKGNEQMFFNASKDMKVDVGNNTTHSVGNDHKVKVGVDQSLTVIDSDKCVIGAKQTIDVAGNQSISVKTLCVNDVKGNHTATVSGNEMQMIGGDQRSELAANSELSIGGNSMMAIVGSITTNCTVDASLMVGSAAISVVGGDRSLIVGGSRTEMTGGAKVLLTKGNHSLEVGSLQSTVVGAVVAKVTGDRADSAGADWTELAGGLQKVEAEEIVIEAQATLTLTMGASVIALNPAMASITGVSVKFDGATVETAPLIVTN